MVLLYLLTDAPTITKTKKCITASLYLFFLITMDFKKKHGDSFSPNQYKL